MTKKWSYSKRNKYSFPPLNHIDRFICNCCFCNVCDQINKYNGKAASEIRTDESQWHTCILGTMSRQWKGTAIGHSNTIYLASKSTRLQMRRSHLVCGGGAQRNSRRERVRLFTIDPGLNWSNRNLFEKSLYFARASYAYTIHVRVLAAIIVCVSVPFNIV